MKRRLEGLKFPFALFVSSLLLQGCLVKPPEEVSLGDETRAEAIDQVKVDALGSASTDDLYRTGDMGTLQIYDKIMSNAQVRQTRKYQVTSIDDTNINYTLSVSSGDNDAAYVGKIPRHTNGALQATGDSSTTEMTLHKILPHDLFDFIQSFASYLIKMSSKISFERSTAVGDTPPVAIDFNALPKTHLTAAESVVETQMGNMLAEYQNDPGSLTQLVKPQPAAPAQTPAPAPVSPQSRYYGLRFHQHRVVTGNCAQISDCKVNARHIEFNELKPDDNGTYSRWHWTIEISNEVPGFFTFLDTCAARLIAQNGSQYPVKSCAHVSSFRFGQKN